MATEQLTYRGVKYERRDPLTEWMMNGRLKRQREEFEAKLDRSRIANDWLGYVGPADFNVS